MLSSGSTSSRSVGLALLSVFLLFGMLIGMTGTAAANATSITVDSGSQYVQSGESINGTFQVDSATTDVQIILDVGQDGYYNASKDGNITVPSGTLSTNTDISYTGLPVPSSPTDGVADVVAFQNSTLSDGDAISAGTNTTTTIDDTQPTVSSVTVTQQGGDENVTTGDTVNVSAAVSDATSGVNTVTVNASKLGGSNSLSLTDGDDDGTYNNTFSVSNSPPASDGSVSLTVNATDNATNTNSSADSITLDTTGPTVSSVTVTQQGGDDTVTTGDTVNVSASVSDATSSVKNVTVDASALGGSSSLSLTDGNNDGTYNNTFSVSSPSAGDGSVSLTVNATDTVGNTNSSADSITLDTTRPAFVSGYPTTSSVTSSGFNVDVNATEGGTAYYVVVSDGDTAPSTSQIKSGNNASGSSAKASGSGSITANTESSLGASGLSPDTMYDVYVVVEDSASNNITSSAVDVQTASGAAATNAYISAYDGTYTEVTIEFGVQADLSTLTTGDITFDQSDANKNPSSFESGNTVKSKTLTVNFSSELVTGDTPSIKINGSGINSLATTSTTVHTTQLDLSTNGEHFVSIPAETGSLQISSLTSEHSGKIETIWQYDNGAWTSWDGPGSASNDFSTLEAGQGYIFVMKSGGETFDINVKNTIQGSRTIGSENLEDGWNLVGHWQEGKQQRGRALENANNVQYSAGVVAQATPGSYSYTTIGSSEKLEPGEAYWINHNGAGSYTRSLYWA